MSLPQQGRKRNQLNVQILYLKIHPNGNEVEQIHKVYHQQRFQLNWVLENQVKQVELMELIKSQFRKLDKSV